MFVIVVRAMRMERWTYPQKNLKTVTDAVAIITVESAWPNVERELSAEADVDLVAMRKIAHVADGSSIDRENLSVIDFAQDQFVAGFFNAFPARVNRIATALIICLD